MAFDGITIANLVHEFKEALGGGRISKTVAFAGGLLNIRPLKVK